MDRPNRKSLKVMWVSLVEFPPLANQLGHQIPSSCGWMYSSATAILKAMPELRLGVIVYSYGKHFEKHMVEGITYYLIPSRKMTKVDFLQVKYCTKALNDFAPDLLHIHGTEYSLAAATCRANNGKIRTIANIQGLAGPYERYADGGLTLKDKLLNITPLDFYRGTFIANMRRRFKHRANCELEVLQEVSDIVGRTSWDHDHALTINPDARYHFMNETLRDSFYISPKWTYETCRPYSIFVSNSGAPLKGAHQILKALPIILKAFPETTARFCGSTVMTHNWRERLRMQGYHLYLRRLVKKLHLEKHVKFTGVLSEPQMRQAFIEANVFVLPSAIENSPNSLGEAQILGVPAVAAYSGGIPDFITHGQTGYLYRYEEIEMLAQTVIRLFRQKDLRLLSHAEIETARLRHDSTANARRLTEIYQSILADA